MQVLQLASCIFSCKLPVHTFLLLISISLPFLQLCIEVIYTINSAFAQALLGQRRKLYFCYVKPASMFWCIMKFNLL